MDALLELPSNVQSRLVAALANGSLAPPYSAISLRGALGESKDRPGLKEALEELAGQGIRGGPAAAWVRLAAKARSQVLRPELVWTGPEVPGLHARDTRQVFSEMLGSAEKSIWASTYAYFDGQKAFEVLAKRMDEVPELEVTLLLNVGRSHKEKRPSEELVEKFSERLWKKDWPGSRRPRVFYFPEALAEDADKRGVLHAKALVQDERAVFITSANFTEAALERNIELGFKVGDPTLARQVICHYQRLIEEQLLSALPTR